MSKKEKGLSEKECWRFNCIEITKEDYYANLQEFDSSSTCYFLLVDISANRSINKNTREFRYFIFNFESRRYTGWVTNSIDKGNEKETYPAYDTWDGWVEIHNKYRFLDKFKKDLEDNEELFFSPAFVSKSKMIEYIENTFPNILRESEFRW